MATEQMDGTTRKTHPDPLVIIKLPLDVPLFSELIEAISRVAEVNGQVAVMTKVTDATELALGSVAAIGFVPVEVLGR